MDIQQLLSKLDRVSQKKGYWLAQCPAHDDKKASLSISEGDKAILLKCHANCKTENISEALGIEMSELFYDHGKPKARPRKGRYAATYDYTDEQGNFLFQVCKTHDKQFFQRHKENGEWVWGLSGVTPVLYKLPKIKNAIEIGLTIFICEGEKDADNLEKIKLNATTSPMGAGKWRPQYTETLRGADVVILPDNDEAGQGHLNDIAKALIGVAKRVRVLRLPNLPPKGDVSDWLSMGGTRSQLIHLVQTCAEEIEEPWNEAQVIHVIAGNREFVFGKDCVIHTEKKVDGEILPVKIPFARCVWPREKYEQIEDGEFGVRYLFRDHGGQIRHGVMPHGASVDAAQASRASAQAANNGVQIAPESKGTFAMALGHWSRTTNSHISLVKTPGWHREGSVYVNGDRIFGASRWKADESAASIEARSGRCGSAQEWAKSALLKTRGVRAALGLALAGPLVGMLGMVPFGVHFCGDSSHGKSTVARLAASVWGNPQRMFQTWNAGRRALEGLADPANGACLILDEIKNFGGKPEHLSEAIHSLCSQQGRARMAPDGKLLQQRRWENTILSTGEVRTRDLLGQHYQGGHRVRMIDAWISSGDLTLDRDHASKLDALAYQNFGVLGDVWIEALLKIGTEKIRAKVEELSHGPAGETNEQQRVRRNLALVATALHFAGETGVLPVDCFDAMATMDWLLEVSRDDIDGTTPSTPNERAWALLLQLTDAQPYRFPFSTNHTTGRDVIAYKVVTSSDPLEFELWTTESMLRASGIDVSAGVQVRGWLDFLVREGRAGDVGRFRLEGMRRRWYKLLVNDTVEKEESVGTELESGTDLFGGLSQ